MTQPTSDPSSIAISFIRTVVPTLIGAGIAWLLSRGFDLTAYENAVNLWLVPLCIAGYYSLFRLLEQKFPWLGVFLGAMKQPQYNKPVAASPPSHDPY